MNRSREFARLLLGKGRDDEWVLARLVEAADAPEWVLGFHAQQAVEKALKAVLAARLIEYPPTHNLSVLVDLVARAGIAPPPDAESLPRLTPFGAAFRYDRLPGQEGIPDRTCLRESIRRTLAWADDMIGE
jgi:HEPN domain-containing protein